MTQIAFKKLMFLDGISIEAKKMFDEIKEPDKKFDHTQLICVHTNGKIHDFKIFRRLGDFIRSIYFDDISLKQTTIKQEEIEYLVRSLKDYKPRNPVKIKSRAEVSKNVEMFSQGRNMIIVAFEEIIFPLPKKEMLQYQEWTEEEKGKEYTPSEERSEIIAEEEEGISNDLFRDYFKYQNPCHLYKNLNSTKKHRKKSNSSRFN